MEQKHITDAGAPRLTITGCDGSGKSIISAIVIDALAKAGFEVILYNNNDQTKLPTGEELEAFMLRLREEKNVLLDRAIRVIERDEGSLKASSR